MTSKKLLAVALVVLACLPHAFAAQPHNVILFVPDGLRSRIVDAKTAPTFARLRAQGVDFTNSHSLFPTFTTANASAFATGHLLGDTGDFSNFINTRLPVPSANNTVTPFLETDPVLREVNGQYDGNYLNEESIVALAAAAKYSTALIGKLGPVAIFDLDSMDAHAGREPATLIVDDSTGQKGGITPSKAWADAFEHAGVAVSAPGRGANGDGGSFERPGTRVANLDQQKYFLDVALKVVLPQFRAANRPFLLVYWSRDPDGTQHNQGDSFGTLKPGINGPTSLAAIRAADDALAAIEARLTELGLFDTTNIVVSADHGFSTISKASSTSPAAKQSYPDVKEHELPLGFLAIDLTIALQKADPALKLFDPDRQNLDVRWSDHDHPGRGNALIGKDAASPQLIVAANGGSDLLYIPSALSKEAATRVASAAVDALLEQDYVSGIFVDESRFGKLPGTLPTSAIGLLGHAVTPHPAIVVNFKSFSTGCDRPTVCAAIVADTPLQQGQGMHGSFSRSDTWNFMAARGPDFRTQYASATPASNADIGMTIATLMGINLQGKGVLAGRVLNETLRSGAGKQAPRVKNRTLISDPAVRGLRTILKTQSVGTHTYFDVAGFEGRTLGLE